MSTQHCQGIEAVSYSDKKYLFLLIKFFLDSKIDARTFCDEYYQSYDLEISSEQLTPLELKVFDELSTIANRFSEFQNDLENYPGVYYSEAELRKAALNAQQTLNLD